MSVEHDHSLVIVEVCFTSWSSDDDDDRFTTSSLDKVDDDATSVAHEDSTSSTLGGDLDDVGSCSSHDRDATTSSPSSPHCFMSQGDTKVQNANVVDHVDSYNKLVTNSCDVGKKHVSTSCDDLLDMPCSSHIDACSTSMPNWCITTLVIPYLPYYQF